VKTISLKKVSAVAVASLGFGLLSAVPAQAASTVGDVYFGTTGTITASTSVNVGVETAVTITVAHTSDATPSAVTLTPTLVKPTASSAGVTSTYLNYTLAAGTNQTAAGQVPNTTSGAIVATSTAEAATATVFSPVIKFKPDVAGVYSLTYVLTGAGSTDGGVRSRTATLTVNAGYFIDADSNKLACQVASTKTTDCTQVAGGRATVIANIGVPAENTTYFVTVDGGTIVSGTVQEASNTITESNTNGTNLAGGQTVAQTTSGVGTDNVAYVIERATAGDATITVKYFTAGGIPTTWATGKVTFTDASVLSISDSSSVFVRSTNTCDATVTASNIGYLGKAAANGSAYLCVVPKNGASAVRAAGVTVIGNGIGSIAGAGAAATAIASNSDGYEVYSIAGNGLTGTGTWTIAITDGTKTVTKTASIVFADTTASTVVITQSQKAFKDGADTAVNTTDDGATIATFSVKDAKSSALAYTVTTANLVVDSDVSTQVSTKAGQNDAAAAITVASPSVSALGVETAGTIAVDCSSTMEKITIKIHLEDNTVASNVITFWCTSDVVDSIVVAAANGSAGVAQDVTATAVAKITGKTGYPVADSATATFFATSGSLANVGAINFNGGVAKVSYANSMVGGSVTITATYAPVSTSNTVASASKTITTTDSISASIASLNAKIVALNALIAKIMKRLNIR
jgi:hypothetical protein